MLSKKQLTIFDAPDSDTLVLKYFMFVRLTCQEISVKWYVRRAINRTIRECSLFSACYRDLATRTKPMGVCVPVEFIWFDLGYTLLYKEREKALGEILSSIGYDLDQEKIDRGFHEIDKLFMRERPGVLGKPAEKFMPTYMELLCGHLGLGCDPQVVLERLAKVWSSADMEWKDYPFVKDTLKRLKASGYRLGVISNWDPSAKPILKKCEILDFFETVVISSEVGYAKPNEKIFRIALEEARVDPSKCLYVGDNYYDDTLGSNKVGMRSLIINRFGRFGVEEIENQALVEDVSGIFEYLEGQGS